MNKIYIVQMEEVVVDKDSTEAVQVLEGFYDETNDLEEAKKNANELLDKIRNHKLEDVPEVFEVEDPTHDIAVCIAVYKAGDSSILDVLDVGTLTPSEWNVKCGDCGAYCSEGTCYTYGHRVEEDQLAESCWHRF